MSQVLRSVPVFEVQSPAAGLGPARRFLRAVLLRAAARAVQVAVRLEQVEAPVQERSAQLVSVRPYAGGRAAGVRLVEAAVCLAVAAYFVAGLVGVFVA